MSLTTEGPSQRYLRHLANKRRQPLATPNIAAAAASDEKSPTLNISTPKPKREDPFFGFAIPALTLDIDTLQFVYLIA